MIQLLQVFITIIILAIILPPIMSGMIAIHNRLRFLGRYDRYLEWWYDKFNK